MIKARIEKNVLHLSIDMQEPAPSSSGKTLVVASTHGNQQTNVQIDGKNVTVGVNAFIPNPNYVPPAK